MRPENTCFVLVFSTSSSESLSQRAAEQGRVSKQAKEKAWASTFLLLYTRAQITHGRMVDALIYFLTRLRPRWTVLSLSMD